METATDPRTAFETPGDRQAEAGDEAGDEAGNEARWRQLVARTSKGGGVDDLATRAEDGFVYGPLHGRLRDRRPLAAAHDGAWTIFQRLDDVDPARAGQQALADLEGGAGGLAICFEGSPSARGFGLPLDARALLRALDGVDPSLIRLRIEPHVRTGDTAEALRSVLTERGLPLEDHAIDLGLDAIGPFAAAGRFDALQRAAEAQIVETATRLAGSRFGGRIVEADGRVFHDAGATDGQELGAVVAGAVHHLRLLANAGLEIADAAASIGFTLAVDQRQFEQTAKLRALRLLWARVLEECGEDASPPARIHAETSFRMLAAKDPHTNILRATTAALSAATGGTDGLAVLPHTAPLGLADAGARRIARNIQVILQEESHLDAVVDPGAGSGGLEALTDRLAMSAWSEFRKIEAEGGIVQSLRAGVLQSRILDAATARRRRLETGEDVVVGATIYPLDEERDHGLLLRVAKAASTGTSPGDAEPLASRRTAEDLETKETHR